MSLLNLPKKIDIDSIQFLRTLLINLKSIILKYSPRDPGFGFVFMYTLVIIRDPS